MNRSLIAVLLLVCAGALYAKEPSKKIKAEVAALQTAAAEAVKADAVQAGLPSSYGQCKGVIADAGRNLLIFESPDDGSVSFVQVTVGKANVSWKLVDRIPRSAD